jgi:hypothetical protein
MRAPVARRTETAVAGAVRQRPAESLRRTQRNGEERCRSDKRYGTDWSAEGVVRLCEDHARERVEAPTR